MTTHTTTVTQTEAPPSFFDSATYIPPDAIFALTAEYNTDTSPNKVNLGQGTYRDENGQPWVLPSVQKSREILLTQGLNHEYLPILGLQSFRDNATLMALGPDLYEKVQSRLSTCQALSGTGSLHTAGLLLRSCHSPPPKIYIPSPTWSNHHQVFSSLGFPCESFTYYDSSHKDLNIESYISALKTATPGSVVILHACAHNPTGCDPTKQQWIQLGQIIKERGLFPLFDAAYLGFNSGNVDDDAFAIRYFVGELGLEVAVCLSFAKNMGLYGERTGCLFLVTRSKETAVNAQSTLEMLQRSEVSNPPAYGAKIAATILSSRELKDLWYKDLETMSGRIRAMRVALYNSLNDYGAPGNWDHLVRQSGMFGFLGLEPDVVLKLKEEYHIYMAGNSRVSIAGLNETNVEYVARSIAECLKGY
ncbi:aromatic-amino-acid aminotransferase [Aspergillus ibericus CBS 121593]|uniref:Aromatic-amino-acid aminotransferase n=1 Tax=Aspergillus ibericus CBS 121593 TaxID=1448316 RepID=A0A395H718_9EURO|nr:aromatic-amino-acid aminotransferase [Aspergillus ibericus CBS 121593]RAL03293.1 aromatic-amino-acid aminotransferase [Aspergillus ibericus CBS 121593]